MGCDVACGEHFALAAVQATQARRLSEAGNGPADGVGGDGLLRVLWR